MLARFATSNDEEPGKRLARTTQIDSIHEYVSEFEELASQVTGIDEKHLVNLFYTGLRREMKEVVKLKEPQGLTNHIAAVVKMEDSMFCQVFGEVKIAETQPHRPYSTPQFRSSVVSHNNRGTSGSQPTKPGQPVGRPPPRVHLTEAELKYKKDNNLCFKCDQPWSRAHKLQCSNPTLQILTVIDGYEMKVLEPSFSDAEPFEVEADDPPQFMQLSLNEVQEQLPSFKLEDKLRFKEGGIVRPDQK